MDISSAGDADAGHQLPGLQGLPEEVLDAVLRQLDARSRLQVFRTSKLLATALLRVVPMVNLTYPTQHDILGQHLRELAPFLTEVLQNRQHPKLGLTLRPAKGLTDAIQHRHRAEPAAAASDAAHLTACMLGAVSLCGAVDSLIISWHKDLDFTWQPAFSAALAASFPSLTSLTFQGGRMSIGHLAQAITHPLLSPRLLHLYLAGADIIHQGQLGRSPFIGSRLQKLCLRGWVFVDGEAGLLSGLLPLPPTLTQLAVSGIGHSDQWDWATIAAAVSSLTQLQELSLLGGYTDPYATGPGLTALLGALAHLPSLHTLSVRGCVLGQEQLAALLELTQITRLEVYGFSSLTSSQASADCNWRQLRVELLDWVTAAYLPLHSLTHPLCLQQLGADSDEPSIELLAAAELNLCERNQAGLEVDEDGAMYLSKATVDLLTEQYLSHIRRTAQQPLHHPTVASSSSHSGPSTRLASSSSPEGHITPGGPSGNIGHGGPAAGGQAVMQRLGRCVKNLHIMVQGQDEARLSSANLHVLPALFPTAAIEFVVVQQL